MRFFKYFSVVCLIAVSVLTATQLSYGNEGLSRQIMSLRSVMESMKNAMDSDISALNGRVQVLEDEGVKTSRCYNRRNKPGLYLPHHDDADNRGCVSADDLGGDTTNVGMVCSSERLEGSTKTCNDCSDAGGVPVDTGGRKFVCKFTASSCPANWTNYQDYKEYTSNSCSATGYGNTFCGACTTAATPFTANPTQPTCQFVAARNRETGGDVHCGGGYGTCRGTLYAVGCR